MLQPVEVWCSLSKSMVTDSRAVVEGEASEAAAVPRYGHQAGVSDLGQHGEGQTVEFWVTHHLKRSEEKQL